MANGNGAITLYFSSELAKMLKCVGYDEENYKTENRDEEEIKEIVEKKKKDLSLAKLYISEIIKKGPELFSLTQPTQQAQDFLDRIDNKTFKKAFDKWDVIEEEDDE